MSLLNNVIVSYIDLYVKNISPLKVGDDEGILIDKVSNKPYLPGTSIAGAFRRYIEEIDNSEYVKQLFGCGDKESKIIFYDSICSNKKERELRPGIKINNRLGVNEKGHFFTREQLSVGHEFKIRIKIFSENSEEKEEFLNIIYHGINAMMNKEIRFGSNKTNGSGIFDITEIKGCSLDLRDKKQLHNYLLDKEELVDIKEVIKNVQYQSCNVEFSISCITDTPMLVKGKDSLDSTMSDGKAIKTFDGKYIIPGSSIKGSFKNGLSKIAKLKGVEELVDEIFGINSDIEEERSIGRLYFEDIEIRNHKKYSERVYNRIKIDKFTGGTRESALLNEEPIKGEMNFNIYMKKFNDKNRDDKAVALIVYTLRDLLQGDIYIGGGSSIGRGKVLGKEIKFMINNEEYIIDLEGNKHKNKEKIEEILSSI